MLRLIFKKKKLKIKLTNKNTEKKKRMEKQQNRVFFLNALFLDKRKNRLGKKKFTILQQQQRNKTPPQTLKICLYFYSVIFLADFSCYLFFMNLCY